jgi:hypothetical protein
VKGEVPHPKGAVGVSVRKKEGGIQAEVELPQDVPGAFVWHGVERVLHPGKQTLEINETTR